MDYKWRDQAVQWGHETTVVGKKVMLTGFDKFIITLAKSVEDPVLLNIRAVKLNAVKFLPEFS